MHHDSALSYIVVHPHIFCDENIWIHNNIITSDTYLSNLANLGVEFKDLADDNIYWFTFIYQNTARLQYNEKRDQNAWIS